MDNKKEIQLNIDLKNTQIIESEDGNLVFGEGFLLRKASKFLTGTTEDALIPIPIIYDLKTGKPLIDSIPEPVRQEYIDFYEGDK